jgi:chromate transport protein ChrA
VADHLRNADGRSVAAVAYGLTMVAIAIMFNAVWRYASRGKRLLTEDADPEAVDQINRSYFLGPAAYGIATILALFVPVVSLVIYAALAIFYMLPLPGQGRVASKVKRH